jgi:hypothetical protein
MGSKSEWHLYSADFDGAHAIWLKQYVAGLSPRIDGAFGDVSGGPVPEETNGCKTIAEQAEKISDTFYTSHLSLLGDALSRLLLCKGPCTRQENVESAQINRATLCS